VSLDVAVELNGFYADACITVGVGRAAAARGYALCGELMGHGIGRHRHEAPYVPSIFDPALTEPLTDGLVLTVEPIVSAGTGAVHQRGDRWTVCTADGALAAHEEHTIVITAGAPLVLTA
jgi:methionyl aminopeptidase